MSQQSFIADVTVFLDSKEDPIEGGDQIVTVNDDSLNETGRIEFVQETNKGSVYLRVEPSVLLQAILRLKFRAP